MLKFLFFLPFSMTIWNEQTKTSFVCIMFVLSVNSVCVKSRCPDVLWLINADYSSKESANSRGRNDVDGKFNILPQCTNACKCSRRNNRKKHAKRTKSETDVTGKCGAAQTNSKNRKHLLLSATIFFIYARERMRANVARFPF